MPGRDEEVYVCLDCCPENEVEKGRVLRDKLRSLVPLDKTFSHPVSLADATTAPPVTTSAVVVHHLAPARLE